MYLLVKNKMMLSTVLTLLFIFHTTLFAGNRHDEELTHVNQTYIDELEGEEVVSMTIGGEESVSVTLNSFGNLSMIVMLILTSLLGTFFVRHELESLLK